MYENRSAVNSLFWFFDAFHLDMKFEFLGIIPDVQSSLQLVNQCICIKILL